MKHKNLHNIKASGFKTPKDYFDTFDEKLLENIKTNEVLPNTMVSGFKTPNSYFDGLEDSIIKTLSDDKDTKVIPLFSKKNIVYISSIAAAVLLLISLSIFNTTTEYDDLETQTVENYIIDTNISSYEIAALLSEEELIEDTFVELNLEDESIEAYLLDASDIESLMIE
ncbi:hypothetical protein [Hyunsoonleella ulvae]|uniref:hypothetical protein n=1 Tax=Hyunsoonleella ulvae TaxID=2799948 RepID=UPI00193ACAAB|nr:hypothetical protein [Hyunsoonleella ulvae]